MINVAEISTPDSIVSQFEAQFKIE
jgi:hypothetical protein